MSTAPAPDVLNPPLVMRYGPPHRTPKLVAVDMQAKCTQNPTRVPGSPQAVRTRDHTDATPLRTSPTPRSRRGEGVGSRSSAATAIAPTSERAPAVAKPAVHPARRST